MLIVMSIFCPPPSSSSFLPPFYPSSNLQARARLHFTCHHHTRLPIVIYRSLKRSKVGTGVGELFFSAQVLLAPEEVEQKQNHYSPLPRAGNLHSPLTPILPFRAGIALACAPNCFPNEQVNNDHLSVSSLFSFYFSATPSFLLPSSSRSRIVEWQSFRARKTANKKTENPPLKAEHVTFPRGERAVCNSFASRSGL